MLAVTIENCVIATNQTYVEALKAAGKFDAEAQKTAFNMTKNAVMAILSDEAKKYLETAVGDLNEYITQQIEAAVNVNKPPKALFLWVNYSSFSHFFCLLTFCKKFGIIII